MIQDQLNLVACNVTTRYNNGMYVKLFSQILDSSIADNRRLRHFFTDLLLCADATGMVMMTDSAIARRIGATMEEVEWGLKELTSPDPLSKTPDHEGRRIERVEGHGYGWKVLNYEMYRAMKDAEQLRQTTRLRVQRHRDKVKSAKDGNVTPCNAGNGIEEGDAEAKAYAEWQKEKDLRDGFFDEPDQSPLKPSWNPTPEQIEIASWYNRRPSTVWNPREIKAWKEVIKTFTFEGDDWDALKWLYTTSGYKFRRKDLITLLNNWNGEIDRAKNYDPNEK